ncbi:MAG: hypothetical protein ACREIC_03785 [Limisphaerales bacterium]
MDSQAEPPHSDRREQASAASVDESPGLPGLHTWRAVYLFVLAVFVLLVVGFAMLSRCFS